MNFGAHHPRMLSLYASIFCGALNDNLLKTTIIIFLATLEEGSRGTLLTSLGAALFVLPYVLFSPLAGFVADKYSKSTLIKVLKAFEVPIGALVFFTPDSVPTLLFAIFLMGAQSAFLSPAKYGFLPEVCSVSEITQANGALELVTFIGILLGTAMSGVLVNVAPHQLGALVILFGLLGAFLAQPIPRTISRISKGGLELRATLQELFTSPPLRRTMSGITFFWSIGALIQLNIIFYAKDLFPDSTWAVPILLVALVLGIGSGSVLAGTLSHERVELGLVPLGGIGLAVASFLLGFGFPILPVVFLALTVLGLAAGLFSVPLNAYFQEITVEERRGRLLGALNLINFLFMLLVSAAFYLLREHLQIPSRGIFFIIAALSIYFTYVALKLIHEPFLMLVNWLLLKVFYRVEIQNADSLPSKGGALLVCNHVSFIDACVIQATTKRPVRFIMYGPIYELPVIHSIVKALGAIPIYPGRGRESVLESLSAAKEALQSGELVAIFAEGAISRTGEIAPFKAGFETIMSGTAEPIIPCYIGGAFGSIFSFEGGRVFWKKPKKIPYPLTVCYSTPLSSATSALEVEEIVRGLEGAHEKESNL